MKKKIDVIDRGGAKIVAKKASFVKKVKLGFAIFSLAWIAVLAIVPLHIKKEYSGPIKKTIVVSMFFDLQRNITGQYEQLLSGIKKSINLEKPIAIAIDKAKIADKAVSKTKSITKTANKLSGIAGKFGVKTGSVDKVVASVDNTSNLVNSKLDSVKKDLIKTSQTEVDKMIDDAIKKQLDKNSGGLGTTMLTNYGVKHVYPWKPSSWPIGVKIYNNLNKSNVGVVQIITSTVDTYFDYVAWGVVFAAWAVGLLIWLSVRSKIQTLLDPFIVCPRCGHAFSDKRTMSGLLKIFQPWKWF